MDIPNPLHPCHIPHIPHTVMRMINHNINCDIWGGWVGVYAQGGLACLAQARQDRPGKGELDLTNIEMSTRP
jgi:hypothetical protein